MTGLKLTARQKIAAMVDFYGITAAEAAAELADMGEISQAAADALLEGGVK